MLAVVVRRTGASRSRAEIGRAMWVTATPARLSVWGRPVCADDGTA
jgi:hypothetical protein